MNTSEDILLAKWLSGDLTEQELSILKNKYDLDALQSILDKQDQYTPETMEADDLWKGIKAKQTEDPGRSPQQDNMLNTKKIHRFLLLILAFVLAKFAYSFLFGDKGFTIINTKDAEKSELLFQDGSIAFIGPQSRLSYNKSKWSESRNIALSGQAYFKVEKGVKFTVSTKAGTVEVLGTEFDVWSIDDMHMRIACSEGRVRVKNKKGTSADISVGEAIYISNGELKKANEEADLAGDWQDNFRNYQTTPVKILLVDLERFYKTSFSVDKSIENDLFSGVLPTDDLEKCVRYLEASLSYESNRKENRIHFKK